MTPAKSHHVDYSHRDDYAPYAAVAPITLRRSSDIELVRSYWENVHGPAISRLDGLARYYQHHLHADRGDHWPPLPGIDNSIADAEQLDGFAELGFSSEDDIARFNSGVADSRGIDDDQNFVHRGTVQGASRGNSRTFVDRFPDDLPNGPVANQRVLVAFQSRAGSDREGFNAAVLGLAEAVAAHDLVWKSRVYVVSDYHIADWDAPNVEHPGIEDQYQGFIELGFKNRLTMQLFYETDEFASSTANLNRHVARVNAFPIHTQIAFVHEGRRTLAGHYGGGVARSIIGMGATLRLSEGVPV